MLTIHINAYRHMVSRMAKVYDIHAFYLNINLYIACSHGGTSMVSDCALASKMRCVLSIY